MPTSRQFARALFLCEAPGATATTQHLQATGDGTADPLGLNPFQYAPPSGLPPDPTVMTIPGFSTAGQYQSGSGTQVFQIGSYINNTGVDPAVALWGMGVGMHCWGSNLGCYSYGGPSAAGIGLEIDFGNMSNAATTINGTQTVTANMTINLNSTTNAYVPTATAPGLMNYGAALFTYTGVSGSSLTGCNLVAGSVTTLTDGHAVTYCTGGATTGIDLVVGTLQGAPSQSFIQFTATNATSSCANGLLFQGGSNQPVNNNGILFNNITAPNGISFNGGNYSQAALVLSSLNSAGYGLLVNNGTFSNAVMKIAPASAPVGADFSAGTFTNGAIRWPAGTTGSGSAALGANCPAVTVTAPYTWLKQQASDGSIVYTPAWK